MRAALEEYNQKFGFPNQSSTLPPMKSSPDTIEVVETQRRRGATVIGSRAPPNMNDILKGGGGGPNIANYGNGNNTGGVDQFPNPKEDDNYNSIKMRYLRSLNISIAAPQKEVQVSASAPIPIPIALQKKGLDSDSESETDTRDYDDDDDDDDENGGGSGLNNNNHNRHSSSISTSYFFNGATSFIPNHPNFNNRNISKSNNNSNSNNNISNGFTIPSNNNNNNNVNTKSNESEFMVGSPEIVPVRKDSKSKQKHKFVPPHELLGNNNKDGNESNIDHSLPGNHRRKVFGQ
eukprot:gene3222-4034_t